MTKTPTTKYLKDYQPSSFLLDTVNLTFDLGEDKTIVTAELQAYKNPEGHSNDLELVGNSLVLRELKLNNEILSKEAFDVTPSLLFIKNLPERFTLTIVTEIYPQNNTELMGLYKSKTMFCTQCEPEGFRRMTYFLDRPDVMAVFTTTIIADKSRYPVLLSNGNLVEQKTLDDNRELVTWQDPTRKPSYLFALVAADLACLENTFVTQSGKKVALKIYVEHGNLDKADHAMFALKAAMRWDEKTFGREYDLDIYMIVAVSDFNMGAMENKGLNIFNTKYVLANPQTATDDDYQAIIGVIGHEYFHNWTGNRITCKNWFQLSLKEGLTIFRDQEFTADMTSRVVKRIKDVRNLRTFQFAEDASPMAHAVRPESYMEMNNFYTHTVYEKGAEVIRMMQTLVGHEGFRRGMDLYFERNDGHAVTIEDFVSAIEDANHVDLGQFRLWYSQAGTPTLTVQAEYDADKHEYTLVLEQSCKPTPEQSIKKPFFIPVKLSLLDQEGQVQALNQSGDLTTVLQLKESKQTFVFKNIQSKPVPVLLHDFSAPVQLVYPYTHDELFALMLHADNLFCRYEAAQQFFMKIFTGLVHDYRHDVKLTVPEAFIKGLAENITQKDLDSAFAAEMLTFPSEKYLCSMQAKVDIEATHKVRKFILNQVAERLEGLFFKGYEAYKNENDEINQAAIAKRQFKNICLYYLTLTDNHKHTQLCVHQFENKKLMTERLSALQALVNSSAKEREPCLESFYEQWQNDDLVIDKWFTIQALSNQPDTFEHVQALTKHPAFTIKNPNRARSLIYAFCNNNMFYFHREDGKGYEFLTDFILEIDPLNSQLAARLLDPLVNWKQYDQKRQALMQKQLHRIAEQPHLSAGVYEIVSKCI